MPDNEVSISAQYTFTIWPKPGTTVAASETFRVCKYVCKDGSVSGDFVAAGNGLCEIKNVSVTLYGEWTMRKGRKTFSVTSWVMAPPDSREGVTEYLCSLKCGIGKKRAAKIYETFGENTWDIIENQPERLHEVGLSRSTIKSLTEALVANQIQGKIMHLLRDTPISFSQVNRLVRQFGEDALNIITHHPYRACCVEGFTFKLVDAIALQRGIDPTNLERRMAAAVETLDAVSTQGHVCYPRYSFTDADGDFTEGLVPRMERLLNANLPTHPVTSEMCDAAITAAISDRLLATSNGLVYTIKRYKEERRIVAELYRLIDSYATENKVVPTAKLNSVIGDYEKETGLTLAESQKEAVRCAMNSAVCVLTGGPGTGKTTTTKAILYAHKKLWKESNPILLSPTGKAARRMTESTGVEASTIHSALQLGYKEQGDLVNEDVVQTLEGNIVLVDETSMADQYVTYELVRAVKSGSKLIFVGDPDQLPSVGSGNILFELIRSKAIPTVSLTVIFRQAESNPIVGNSARIREGTEDLFYNGTSFSLLKIHDQEKVFRAAVNMYLQSVAKYGTDSTVLLCPYRSSTALNVNRFNLFLQDKINPKKEGQLTMKGKVITDTSNTAKKTVATELREGDIVMQTRNTPIAKNGDIGVVKRIHMTPDPDTPGTMVPVADIEWNGDGNDVEMSVTEVASLDLAYCSTVHKSQGSEYQNVIMVMHRTHERMLKRNLFYTGVTRAKENVLLVGEVEAVKASIRDNKTLKRFSLLGDRLHAEQMKRQQKQIA